MGILSKMQEKATKEWAQNLTLEQIEEYERQGMDMSEYRVLYEEQRAAEQSAIDAIALEKLDKYKNARSADFVDEVAKFNKVSDKNKPQLELAPLVYGRVVQAAWNLFKPCTSKKNDGGGIVFLFALDDAHRYNEEWLAKTAERISAMKDKLNNQPESLFEKICNFFNMKDSFIYSITLKSMFEKKKRQALPEDCREFIGTLCNDKSSFCFPLGTSLNEEGADAWCAVFSLDDQNKLPLSHIPQNKIIPFLLSEDLKERLPKRKFWGGIDGSAQLIPPTYYTK